MVATYGVYVAIMVFNQTIITRLGLKNPYEESEVQESEAPAAIGKSSGDIEAGAGTSGKITATESGKLAVTESGKLRATESGKVSLCSEKRTGADLMAGVVLSSRNLWDILVPGEREAVSIDKGGAVSDLKPVEVTEGQTAEVTAEKTEATEETEAPETYWEPVMWVLDKVLPSTKEWLWTLFASVCLLIGGFTYFAVDSTLRLGCLAEIPPIIMGLIIMAAGTSVPDAIGSFVVAKQGYGDMAVANAVGSNTINILVGLGLPWMLYAAVEGPIDMPTNDLEESILILIGCLMAYLTILTVNKFRVTKVVGGLMLATYVSAIVFIVVRYYTK